MKTVKVVLLSLLVAVVAGTAFVFAHNGPSDMMGSPGMHERGTGGFIGRFMEVSAMEVVAGELGLTPRLLQDAIATGASLETLTVEAGLTVDDVVSSLVSERKAAVDEAVAQGALSEERAVTMMGTYEARTRAAFENSSFGLPWMQAGGFDRDRVGRGYRQDDNRYGDDRYNDDQYEDDRYEN